MATNLPTGANGPRTLPAAEKYFVWMILLVTGMVYAGTARFDFVYDDSAQIVHNPFLRAWRFVPQYFVSSVWKQMYPLTPGNYYRPMFLAFGRSAYWLFADRPFGWHVLAIVLHLVVTWLVYVLLRKLTGNFTVSWLAALIFGVHPVHHEVVAWVSGATESLFAIFFLLAFLAYLKSLESSKGAWMAACCALYALAVLSKETAIVLPLLIFVHAWIGQDSEQANSGTSLGTRFRGALIPAATLLPIGLVYLLVRNRVLAGMGHSISQVSSLIWMLTLPSILLFYIKNWLLPFRLSEFYDVFYQSGFSPTRVLLPIVILAALAAAIWMARKRLGSKAVGHAVAWIIVPLLPALDLFVFKPDELVHDRYFYVPSIGAALLIALLIERGLQSRSRMFGQPLHVVASALALAVVLAFLAGRAAMPWTSDYDLHSRGHSVAPLNSTAMNDLGVELMARRDLNHAESMLNAGYQAYPHNPLFSFNLARLYYRKGDIERAEALVQQAKALDPGMADAYVLLGQIRLKQNRLKEAQDSLQRAVDLNPYSAPFHTSYGIVLALSGDCTAADQQFEAALSLNPGDGLTQVQLLRCRAALSSKAPATKPGQP